MGQRLNVEIAKNGKTLANSYYHWSAYTSSAMELTDAIIEIYYDILDDEEKISDLSLAVKLLESTGAGLNSEERARIRDGRNMSLRKVVCADCQDRNHGLLSITQEGIKETRQWEEARVVIDIGNEVVYFGVVFEFTREEYIDEFGSDDGLQTTDFNFDEISFESFGELREILASNPNAVKTSDGIYMWIQ